MTHELIWSPSSADLSGSPINSEQAGLQRLKESTWFGADDPECRVWECVMEARDLLESRPHDTLYYPGAYIDVAYPLALDATNIVVADPRCSQDYYRGALSGILRELGCDPTFAESAGQDGPTTATFTFGGKERALHLYPYDAALHEPEVLAEKGADVLLLKNTYGGTDLTSETGIDSLIRTLNPNGGIVTYIWGDHSDAFIQRGFEEAYSGVARVRGGFGGHVQIFTPPTGDIAQS
jgi:hypothetical protein